MDSQSSYSNTRKQKGEGGGEDLAFRIPVTTHVLCSQEVSLRSAERPAQRPEPALRSESGSLGPLGKAELGVKAESGGPVGGSISSEELGPPLSESTTLRTIYAL